MTFDPFLMDRSEDAESNGADEFIPTVPQTLLFTLAQAAFILQVPKGWLRAQAKAGTVQRTQLGRSLRFSHDDLQAIITGHRHPAAARD